jgi:bifunctional DNA-binding transcriptional regulator/antitoxin component of YhaV-PrlF toxin-antitoxin module
MNAPVKHLSSDVQMRVSATGKVHLPTSVRAQLGLEEGGVLIAKNENGKLWLTSLRQEMIAMREEL